MNLPSHKLKKQNATNQRQIGVDVGVGIGGAAAAGVGWLPSLPRIGSQLQATTETAVADSAGMQQRYDMFGRSRQNGVRHLYRFVR
jgi:hypothetical protein